MNKIISRTISGLWQAVGVIVTLFMTGLVGALMQKGYWVEAVSATLGILALVGLSWLVRGAWYRNKSKQKSSDKADNSLEEKSYTSGNRTILLVIAILLGFGVAGGLFFWFQIRPSQIRKECDSYARSKYSTYDAYKSVYIACLHKAGLE
ncbi:MAG: hypothetical protein ACD_40C00331G0010 [uncultured bacterium]|nr:MAG: hypothetical protein ACD_40C00331G0010 [uncultured bacterium]